MTTYYYRVESRDIAGGSSLEEDLVVMKVDACSRIERVVPAREAFVAGEALAVLSIIRAQLESLGAVERSRIDSSLVTAINQADRVLKEAGR